MYWQILKRIFKCGVVLLAVILLDILVGHLATMLNINLELVSKGIIGTRLYLFLLTVGLPTCSAVLAIGILGGLWLKEKPLIGFILSALFTLFSISFFMKRILNFDFLTFLVFLQMPAVILAGGCTYRKVYNKKHIPADTVKK
jgi:hypothetical protein